MAMPGIGELIVGHALMLYACASLAAAWAWGGTRGVPDWMLTVFGVAVPVGAWTLSISKVEALWAAPASFVILYFLAVRARQRLIETMDRERAADRAAAEDRAISRPDDGAARMTLAKVAEEEGRWDDALDHYEAAHKASDRMFTEMDLKDARDRIEVERALAARPKGLRAHPLDAGLMAASAALALTSPVRGLAPLAALLFVAWLRGDLGRE